MHKERNSSVELLRIIAMFCIVCSHFCRHGGFEVLDMGFSWNKILLQAGLLGHLGVAVFVMISGYFLSRAAFRWSRIVRVILLVDFYSVSIYLLLVVLGRVPFSVMGAIRAVLPVLFDEYWFATAYIVLCILSPFLNSLLNSFSPKQYWLFLGTILVLWSIIPTFTAQTLYGNELGQFVMYYSLGAFAGKYPDASYAKKYRYWIAGMAAFLMVLSTVLLNVLAIRFPVFNRGNYFYYRQSILVIALAYALLLIFANRKPKSNGLINAVSSTTFGIYLIHDNNYLREVLWMDLLRVQEYRDSAYLVLYLLGCVVLVFVCCSALDFCRQKLLARPAMHILKRLIRLRRQ